MTKQRNTRKTDRLLPGSLAQDQEWARFLNAIDVIAPHVWLDLKNRAASLFGRKGVFHLERQMAAEWCARHHLGKGWALELALNRLLLTALGYASADRWMQLNEVSAAAQGMAPPTWTTAATWVAQPGESEASWRERTAALAAARYQSLRAAGWEAYKPAPEQNLMRLARWQVLTESPETIAKAELGFKGPIRAGTRQARRVATRAKDIRVIVKQLSRALGLPPRPSGQRGRPPRRPAAGGA